MPKAKPGPTVSAHRITHAITHRNLPLLLLQGRESVIARFRPILNQAGLTEQQWRVLRALLEQGAMEPREIVERCRISSPSLSGVLARMDEMGLVQRQRPDHDQRRVIVQATAAARKIAAAIAPRIEATYAALERKLGAPLLQRVYDTLDELVAALDDVAAESVSASAARRSAPAVSRSPGPASSRARARRPG